MQETGDGAFPTTHWTLIKRLKSDDQEVSRRALDDLCGQYRYPLYCYIRRRGLDHHDAQDALHDFIAKLLRLGAFEDADAQRGHLRAFLATALQRFLLNWHRDRARLRQTIVEEPPESPHHDENRYQRERFSDEDTPDRVFDRKWAHELLSRVLMLLGEQCASRGKPALFTVLSPVLTRGGSLRGEDIPTLAQSLDMKEPALRAAHSRLLRDYRNLLESEVRQTVDGEKEMRQEIAYFRGLFEGR